MIELRNVTYSVPETSSDADGSGGGVAQPTSADEPHIKPRRARRLILDDVSFQVPTRSITCIMGISGSGKTTLLRLMAGLSKPDSGQILIDGLDIVPMSERELNEVRRRMGFVFQYGALFDSLSVRDNVAFGLIQMRRPKAEIERVVDELLREVGLGGVSNVRNRLPSELSGGMRKRVAMARALATEPQMVLYDEPTSGLDPVMARVVDDLIVELRDRAGTTNVVVSHHLSSILRISDRVLMLHGGRIVVQGAPSEIERHQDPIVRQFLEGEATGPITVV